MEVNAIVRDVDGIKRLVATVNRMLYMEGHISYSGHVSMRHPEEDIAYMNPLRIARGELRPEDVVAVHFDNEPVDSDAPDPVGEREIHNSIYRAREDITAVLHTHAPATTVHAITGTDMIPVSQRGSILAEGPVPFLERPGKITTPEESEPMLDEMGDQKQLLIKNHGAVICDETIVRAFARAVFLENNAEWQQRAATIANPNGMTQEQVERVYERGWKERSIEKFWHFFEWKAQREGYLPEEW